MPKNKVILNVDPGIDDLAALVLAKASGNIEVLALITSYGNKSVDITTSNTLRLAELLNLNVPIAVGNKTPLIPHTRIEYLGSAAHGDDGLGNKTGLLPYPVTLPKNANAVEVIAKLISESPDLVSIISTAPLTNIAILLLSHPELKEKIDSVIFSGGASHTGNILPGVEANILADPEAAQIVLQSGVRTIMCPIEAGEEAYLTFEDRERLKNAGTLTARFMFEALWHYADHYENLLGREGCPIHDSVPLAFLIDPKLIETKEFYVEIDLTGYFTRGATMIDKLKILNKQPNLSVVTSLDRNGVNQLLFDSLRRVK